jgi:cytochrome b
MPFLSFRPGRARPKQQPSVPVWDIPVRAFHWLLVAAFATSAATGFLGGMTSLRLHLIAGTTVAGLVAARVVWGLLGPTYARFAAFAYGPRAVLGHVRDAVAGRVRRHLGHNPLGAQMVFALLAVLAGSVASGTVALGGMFKQGPLGAFAAFSTGATLLGVHRALGFALLAMVTAHLAGVAFEGVRGRENLAAAMIGGRKRPEPADRTPLASARPLPAAASLAVLGLLGGFGTARLAALPAPHMPPAALDPAYDAACGSCHFAFSPSLNPGWVWDRIMDHLDRHFGLHAPVTAQQAASIRRYLDANAAEHWDSLPAHVFRLRDPAEPLRITATPYWRRLHAGIPAAVFASQAVSGKVSCNSCHADAAPFAPQAIAIPGPQ